MRIWLVPSAFAPHKGGVEELTLKQAQELGRRGHDVLVLTQREPAELPESDLVEGVVARRFDFASPGRSFGAVGHFVTASRAVLRSLDQLPRPDVVHIQCPSNQTAAIAWWTRRRRVPLVITTQGEVAMDAHRIYQRSAYLRLVLRVASRRAEALTACSEWAASAAAAVAPAFDHAAVVFNGVDAADWASIPAPPEDPVFGAWGRHVEQKGFDLLLEAFARVRESLPNARLLLGGSGPETGRLTTMAGEGVEMLGPLDREGVRRLLAATRIVVVPSRIEPFGIVAVEAMAAGRECVCSADTGLAEATAGIGRTADVTNTGDLAAAMLSAVAQPYDGAAARARAAELDWSVITDSYEQIYRDVMPATSS